MSASPIDGKALADRRREELRARLGELRARGVEPCLAAISAGEDPAWRVYQGRQEQSCAAVGIAYRREDLGPGEEQVDLLERIETLNADPAVHGIILQAPLPEPFDLVQAQALIAPAKDVEGVSPANLGQILAGREGIAPCTARAAFALARHALGDLRGVEAVVIGASTIVGKPVAQLLTSAGATVSLCHIDTRDVARHSRNADLVVVAVGKPGLLTADMVKPGACVIDVGINRVRGDDGKMRTVGDVADEVWAVAAQVTPVPGGVGALTTTVLLEHTEAAARHQAQASPAMAGDVLTRVLGEAGLDLSPDAAAGIARLLSQHLVPGVAGAGAEGALQRRLRRGILVLDGGVGTAVAAAGGDAQTPPASNLAAPELVEGVHRAFIAAGADAITANTFGLNRWHCDREHCERLVRAGVRLARHAARGRVLVLGSIGPLGPVVGSDVDGEAAADAVAELAMVMADAGVDAILCETLPSTAEAVAHVRGVRRATRLPVLVSRRSTDDDVRELAEFAAAMEREGATAVGLNCVRGPRALAEGVARLAGLTRLPVLARPNAGDPRRVGDGLEYQLRPEWFVEQARAYVAAGVRLVGGCCGVGPEHIAALHAVRTELAPQPARAVTVDAEAADPAVEPHPLLRAVAAGGFPSIALLAGRLRARASAAAATRLVGHGAAAVGLDAGWPGSGPPAKLPARLRHLGDATGAPAILAIDPWAMGVAAAQEQLLAAHLLGIRLVLVDNGLFAAERATAASDARPCGPERLLELVRALNRGRDAGGTRIEEPTAFTVGIRLRVEDVAGAAGFAACGADFATLQPVYAPAAFRAAMSAYRSDLPLFAEVLVLPDRATAEELDNEVPALSVPERLKLRLGEDPEEDVRGVTRFLSAWRDRLAGACLLLPDERTAAAEAVLTALGDGR